MKGLVRGILKLPKCQIGKKKFFSNYCIAARLIYSSIKSAKAIMIMSSQQSFIKTFHELHTQGDPLVLYNIWDPGSAKAVAAAGAKSLATGSAPVAMARGYPDGEKIPLEWSLTNVERIIGTVELPVSLDLEGGYGKEPTAVEKSVKQAVATGIVGFNFEDQIVGGEGLYDIATQTERVAAARNAADSVPGGPFVNARTDIFLKAKPDTHTDSMLSEAI